MFWYSTKSLIVFYEAVERKSFTRAAEALFMTQPGISFHIGGLESYLGVKLLDRKDGKFELTEEGKAVFKYAEKIYKMQAEFERLALGFKGTQTLRLTIGASPAYCQHSMPKVIVRFAASYPTAQVRIDADNSDALRKRLFRGETDIVIAPNYKPSSQIWSVPFNSEELMLIVSRDHELASRERVSFREMEGYPFALREEGSATRRMILSYLKSTGVKFPIAIVGTTDFIREWVSQNNGISIVTKSAATDSRLRALPIEEKPCLEVCVMCLKARRYELAIARFVRHLID